MRRLHDPASLWPLARFSSITSALTAAPRARVEAVVTDVEREAVVNALVEHTDMARAEAGTEADRLIARFEDARRTAPRV